MSNVCSFCPVKGSAPAGKWLVRGDCVGGRDPPGAATPHFASSLRAWAPNAAAQFRCNMCLALDAAKRRESVVDEYKDRCDPSSVRRDILVMCPWMAGLRRAPPSELRSALLRAKKHLPPSNTSGLEDVLGQGGEVPSGGTSLLLMTAQLSGVGAQAERVAMESVGRIRLSRSPHMK